MNENELTTTSEQDIEKIRERAFRQREAFRRMHGGTSEAIPREPKRAHDYIYQPGYSERVSVNVPEHSEAVRMLKFLEFFSIIEDETLVPNNSIIREFIGGSVFTS